MRYIPITKPDRDEMLNAIGAKSMEELFASIPKEFQLKHQLVLPNTLSEVELVRLMEKLAEPGEEAAKCISFLGGGIYRHYQPAFIPAVFSRQEFLTAYTPYQPEASQGTLPALYEFQSLICLLTGMDVSNASLYDGATAAAEAVLMARRINKHGDRVYVSRALHPNYREVMRTYLRPLGIKVCELDFDRVSGRTVFHEKKLEETFCVVMPYPNYFGVIEDLAVARDVATASGSLLVSVTTEPLSLALLKPPGEFGVDIAVGEGQSFGLPPSYGGPCLGLIATKKEHMRQLPGRIIGKGKDIEGKDAYLIVIATREQHIKREKATSNICTNETWCALCAGAFLSAYGKEGLPALAMQNLEMKRLLRKKISGLKGVSFPFTGSTFNEFVVRFKDRLADSILKFLAEEKIFGGISFSGHYGAMESDILVSVTEMNTPDDVDAFIAALKKGGVL